ncbi:hypothetical protein AC1031_013983 [Aphanomyces cochlioides]|nr:hypothetical protein AC1031_013983 [Aphanomyces cochlioides]
MAAAYGWTPLHWAGYHGDIQVLELLLEAGANVHLETEAGQTARDLGNEAVQAYFDRYQA